jgi:hypothetical protein
LLTATLWPVDGKGYKAAGQVGHLYLAFPWGVAGFRFFDGSACVNILGIKHAVAQATVQVGETIGMSPRRKVGQRRRAFALARP